MNGHVHEDFGNRELLGVPVINAAAEDTGKAFSVTIGDNGGTEEIENRTYLSYILIFPFSGSWETDSGSESFLEYLKALLDVLQAVVIHLFPGHIPILYDPVHSGFLSRRLRHIA